MTQKIKFYDPKNAETQFDLTDFEWKSSKTIEKWRQELSTGARFSVDNFWNWLQKLQ